MRDFIQLQLMANVIKEQCSTCEHVIFSEAWCSQDRVIRFTTAFFRKILSPSKEGTGKWKTGDLVMFEVHNYIDRLEIECVLAQTDASYEQMKAAKLLMKHLGISEQSAADCIVLKRWILNKETSINELLESFKQFLINELIIFEKEIEKSMSKTDTEEVLKEGETEYLVSKIYERNKEARKKCLEVHGTSCRVCGIDFGNAYGPQFAGKIEVHHIVPISQIGKEYVVDPVKDLVPVCPNCHMALHSKPNGVYTVEELIELRNQSAKK